MALRLSTHWLWDFWLARSGPEHHLFYLQAPRSLEEEDRRHWHASIGHAISTDLRHWEILPDALHPGAAGAWDDLTVWTGSVLQHDGRWWMLYTGVSRRENGRIQRIGLATSEDLVRWKRHPGNPLIETDPRWYERGVPEHWHDQAWRDPALWRHPTAGTFHAFITARANDGPPRTRGVIAHARSKDLERWEVLPPVTEPCGRYGQLEVPQLVEVEGRWLLLFSRSIEYDDPATAAPTTGTNFYVADDPLGPFPCDREGVLTEDAEGSRYSGKLVMHEGRWWFLAFRNLEGGRFIGELIDPVPVTFADGRPQVDRPHC